MRYEHIELDISTKACDELHRVLAMFNEQTRPLCAELQQLRNNLRARLQRRDVDPHCPLNLTDEELLA